MDALTLRCAGAVRFPSARFSHVLGMRGPQVPTPASQDVVPMEVTDGAPAASPAATASTPASTEELLKGGLVPEAEMYVSLLVLTFLVDSKAYDSVRVPSRCFDSCRSLCACVYQIPFRWTRIQLTRIDERMRCRRSTCRRRSFSASTRSTGARWI